MRKTPHVAAATLWLAAAAPEAILAAGAATAPTACMDLVGLKVPGTSAVVQKAELLPAGRTPAGPGALAGLPFPAHCRVEGVMDERTGRNGKPYAISFALSLPEAWNGRFLFQGGGGLNGTLPPPLGAVAAAGNPALARGFAVASTDSGHRAAGPFDAAFLEDQEATLNFLYAATQKVTVVAKHVVHVRYGRGAERSYFAGCSTGGREAMLMSQRVPDYYDGIIAGAPAMRTGYSNLALRWVTTSLNAVAPKDEQGRAVTSRALSPTDRKLVVDGFLAACDALDGARDRMVFDTRGCKFDPATLACSGAKTDACLAPAQAAAVARAFGGPKTAAGQQVYPGFLYDTGMGGSGPGIPGLLVTGTIPEGVTPTGTEMNVEADAARAHDGRAMAGDSNGWTNLATFSGRGGKLIFFHGVSDPWFSALDTVDYYERLGRDNGGAASVAGWSRLFLVPGMGHCSGGEAALDRFDLLEPLVDWVEKGKAPESVVATGAAFPQRSRPLCAYPQHARYRGTGDAESAASFSCAQ